MLISAFLRNKIQFIGHFYYSKNILTQFYRFRIKKAVKYRTLLWVTLGTTHLPGSFSFVFSDLLTYGVNAWHSNFARLLSVKTPSPNFQRAAHRFTRLLQADRGVSLIIPYRLTRRLFSQLTRFWQLVSRLRGQWRRVVKPRQRCPLELFVMRERGKRWKEAPVLEYN